MWKAVNVENYPTKVDKITAKSNAPETRACANGFLREKGRSVLTQETLSMMLQKPGTGLQKQCMMV